MTELETLAEEVGVNERTLRRAVNEGTLRAKRSTPRRLRISAAERQYVRRSWPLLADLRQALRTEHNVRLALLFGSTARGEDGPQSDVDVLVEMRDPSFGRVADLSTKLEALLGRRVDVVTRKDAGASAHLLAEAAADGRVLVDREGDWPALHSEAGALARRARVQDRRRSREALAGIDRLLAG
jgi:predicted nucleotidyltransferase